MKSWLFILFALAATGSAHADPATALKQALVGRHVMVPFDMPVNYLGVDFDGDHEMARDDDSRLDRIDTWGASLRGGEIAVITDVRVSKREIQILLGKGGLTTTELLRENNPNFRYGIGADRRTDSDPHSIITRAQAVDSRELGSDAARIIHEMPDTLGQAQARQLVERSRLDRANVGSRLRIRFKTAVAEELLQPKALMLALSQHVMFVREPADGVAPDATPPDSQE